VKILLLAALSCCIGPAARASGERPPPVFARVVVSSDPAATASFTAVSERLPFMLERGLTNLANKADATAAWHTFLRTNDVVGLKVYSSPGALSGTRPAVVGAIVDSLLRSGFSTNQIIIWDKRWIDLRFAGFTALAEQKGIACLASAEAGYDSEAFYDSPLLGKLVWGDSEFGKKGPGSGRKSFVSNLVSKKLTRIINITPLLNHNLAGVSGNLFGLCFGSLDNTLRFEAEPERLNDALPDMYALPSLGDKVALNIVDALLCQYQGEERSFLHYSVALNQLRFSTDPVALDVLSLLELEKQRTLAKIAPVKVNKLIYENAGLLELGVSDPARIVIETVR